MSDTPTNSTARTLDDRKAAIRAVLGRLAEAADVAGLASVARDIRTVRVPKLDEERFSLVVLGEFNHGKSTFVNALLGQAVLPTGITPTTAVLAHLSHGPALTAELVLDSGERRPLDPARLGDFATVEGLAANAAAPKGDESAIHHIDLQVPASVLEGRLTIVDTPGVNDINEQRAEITYGYIPRADAALFLLDGTQILTASERQFLQERILRSSRERLIFVIAKTDLLDEAELAETTRFAREHLSRIVPEPAIFPISARRELAGKRETSGFGPLLAHIGATVGTDRRRLLLDHALGDGVRLSAFVRQSLAMRRRSLELPLPDLEERIARARTRLASGQKGLDAAAGTIRAETAALKARVRQDLAAFTAEFRERLSADLETIDGHDIRRYLSFFIQDTWKAWMEGEGEMIAAELERLAEKILEVASENVRDVTDAVSAELGPTETKIDLAIDTLKYDASVFALGALGTTVFLFVNSLVGGVLALAAPVLAVVLRGKIGREIKAEAKGRAPEAVDRVAAFLGPKLDEAIDTFGARLSEFVAQAGAALARGIAEVLDRALAEKRAHTDATGVTTEATAIDAAVRELKAIDEQLADVRQTVWET
ncbi:MAG TPA: dynamin family protein [Polyangia bacterium]|jgi:GTPase SAR1 family protein